MVRVYVGALLIVAGIAAFIEAHSHQPRWGYAGTTPAQIRSEARWEGPQIHFGLTETTYDLLRIGAWALLLLGALTVILGLIRYARPPNAAF